MGDSTIEDEVRVEFARLGLTPERLGVEEYEHGVRGEVKRLELIRPPTGSDAARNTGDSASQTKPLTTDEDGFARMGRMARWEEAIKRPPLTDEDRARLAVQAAELEELRAAEFTCPYCEDARAIRPRAGVVVPCPECVTVETRMAMAGVPDQFHDVRLEAMETLDGKKAAIVAAARWNLADSVLVFSRGRPVDKAFGTGKTMLACAMLRRVLEARGRTVRFVDAQDLLERMKAAMDAERGQGERAMEDAIEVDVLVLDDIGAERATEWAIDRLSYLIRERYARQRTTIITTNLMSPEQVEGVFGGRVASRLSSYLWVPMGGDDLRHRERGQR